MKLYKLNYNIHYSYNKIDNYKKSTNKFNLKADNFQDPQFGEFGRAQV